MSIILPDLYKSFALANNVREGLGKGDDGGNKGPINSGLRRRSAGRRCHGLL